MAWGIKVAELVDWFLVHLDDWTEPVTVGQIVAALKHLQAMSLIYRHHEENTLVYWLPVRKHPVCAIQEFICKGFHHG